MWNNHSLLTQSQVLLENWDLESSVEYLSCSLELCFSGLRYPRSFQKFAVVTPPVWGLKPRVLQLPRLPMPPLHLKIYPVLPDVPHVPYVASISIATSTATAFFASLSTTTMSWWFAITNLSVSGSSTGAFPSSCFCFSSLFDLEVSSPCPLHYCNHLMSYT